MKTAALCVIIPLTIVAALIIEACFVCYELASACVSVLITGKTRQF